MTSEAFLAWYELKAGRRYELLDGVAVAMSAEQAAHVRMKSRVHRQFERQIEGRALDCEAFIDGMAVRVDEANVFEPDALVRCGPALPGEATLIADPVIVVEVASPSTQRVDALTKLTRYFTNPHIQHYLIVLPAKDVVIHHRRVASGGIAMTHHERGCLVLEPPGLELDVSALFASSAAG